MKQLPGFAAFFLLSMSLAWPQSDELLKSADEVLAEISRAATRVRDRLLEVVQG